MSTEVSAPCLIYDTVGERWFVYGENVERLATCYRRPDGGFHVSSAEILSRREVRLLVDALESLLAAEPEPEPHR